MTEDKIIFADMIAEKSSQQADLDVLTFVTIDDTGTYREELRTYRQLWEKGQALAVALDELNIQQGDTFALLMQNHPEFVDAMMASSILGTVYVPIDPRVLGAKLSYMINFAECKGIICADYCLDALVEVITDCPQLEWILVISSGAAVSLPELKKNIQWYDPLMHESVVPLVPRVSDPDAAMQLLFTSGTTGDPKAIMSSYRRYHSVACIGPTLGIVDNDRLYTGLSLTHANAQLITMGIGLKMGLRVVISRKFTKSRLWEICRHYGCTVFNLLGGMTTAIYSEKPKLDDVNNPVRMVLSAGMPKEIWDDFSDRFGVEIFEIYGAAEGGLTFNPPGIGPPGSIGKPPTGMEAKILDEDDNECPINVPGEMCFRNVDGSEITVDYFKDPEASVTKTREGWLRMGDVCHRDEQGWFYFDYRKGGGIRKNGDFVNTAFVEKIFSEFEGVDDVFVYGLETEDSAPGEKEVVAAVVPSSGNDFDMQQLFSHCRVQLDKNSIPKFVQLLDEIPKTASEKPQERYCLEAFRKKTNDVYESETYDGDVLCD